MTERPPVAEMKRLLFAKIAELRELEGRATKTPWWWDSYNTLFDKDHRIMCHIPDHPTDDGPYEPEQIAERSAWYAESANNIVLIEKMRNTFRASLNAHEAFLKQECTWCSDIGRWKRKVDESCACKRPAQIQALYEALCGGEK